MNSIRNFIMVGLLLLSALTVSQTPVGASEPTQDEDLAYAVGVTTYIWGYPMMDLYRTLWETSLDPERGHDRTLNEFFRFDRLVTSEDDWVITPNNDTIYDRVFMDLRAEPMILSIPPTDRQFWFRPVFCGALLAAGRSPASGSARPPSWKRTFQPRCVAK